jgi:hypothetical protein
VRVHGGAVFKSPVSSSSLPYPSPSPSPNARPSPCLLCPTDLHKIGGLPTLLELLDCRHPGLRWRAAEVVATCMANNPPVQQVSVLLGGPGKKMCSIGTATPACRMDACMSLCFQSAW